MSAAASATMGLPAPWGAGGGVSICVVDVQGFNVEIRKKDLGIISHGLRGALVTVACSRRGGLFLKEDFQAGRAIYR